MRIFDDIHFLCGLNSANVGIVKGEDEAALVEAGLIKGKKDGIKLLGQGEINVALNVKLNHVSTKAREKIEAAGGSVEVV